MFPKASYQPAPMHQDAIVITTTHVLNAAPAPLRANVAKIHWATAIFATITSLHLQRLLG